MEILLSNNTQYTEIEKISNITQSSDINLNLNNSGSNISSYFRVIFSLFISYIVLTSLLFLLDIFTQGCTLSIAHLQKNKRQKQSEQYEKFEINLSLESLNEMDVLRRMTIALEKYWKDNKLNFSRPPFDRNIYFIWTFILSKINVLSKDPSEPTYENILFKLSNLRNRMSGEVTSKKEVKINPNITTGITKGLTRIAMPLGSFSNKDQIVYPIANSKEAEDQLARILYDINTLRDEGKWGIKQFAFVIDELDKIEPHGNANIEEREYTNPYLDIDIKTRDTSQYRRRQEV
ncbi:MAG: hypothetical protein V3V00_03985 [Saprospiraceae bacterium]